jgi:hypothetical protein
LRDIQIGMAARGGHQHRLENFLSPIFFVRKVRFKSAKNCGSRRDHLGRDLNLIRNIFSKTRAEEVPFLFS